VKILTTVFRATITAVYWQVAPDRRMLRTLDWMNDACEAKLRAKDRPAGGALTYHALMSPVRVQVSRRRGKPRNVKGPVSVLITDKWLIVATKRRLFRWAWVRKFDRSVITAGPAQNKPTKCPGFEFLTEEELDFFTARLPNVTATIGTGFASP
jgi:hypothetical protein